MKRARLPIGVALTLVLLSGAALSVLYKKNSAQSAVLPLNTRSKSQSLESSSQSATSSETSSSPQSQENSANVGLAAVRRAWLAVLDGRPASAEDAAIVKADVTLNEVVVPFLSTGLPELQVLNVASRLPADLRKLEAAGIATQLLRRFLETFLACEADWSARLANVTYATAEARERVLSAEQETAWVDRVLSTGRLRVADPLTGKDVDACDSMIVFDRALYRFEGQEPFFLITAPPWSAPQGFYLPRRHLAITFGGERQSVLKNPKLTTLMSRYLQERVRHKPPSGAKGFTLLIQPTDNFAHQHWNYHTGVERALQRGLIGKLAAVRFSGTEFFGGLKAIFPELARMRIERPPREVVVDPAPYDPRGLVLPAAGFFVPRSLTERVIRLMRASPRKLDGAIEPADVPRAPGAPVVWLGLRVRGRAWIGQEEGFARIIAHIHARRPDALFLIDGFSFPFGEDDTSRAWGDALERLHGMAKDVRAAAPPGAHIIDMVGNTMRESVLWAAQTDLYLCPYGTAQHKVAWFTPAPGIVYAPPAIQPKQAARSAGFVSAEITTLPELVTGEVVTEAQEEVGPARAAIASVANVHLDADRLAARMWALLKPRFPSLTGLT